MAIISAVSPGFDTFLLAGVCVCGGGQSQGLALGLSYYKCSRSMDQGTTVRALPIAK